MPSAMCSAFERRCATLSQMQEASSFRKEDRWFSSRKMSSVVARDNAQALLQTKAGGVFLTENG
jgi:hypothetical protein